MKTCERIIIYVLLSISIIVAFIALCQEHPRVVGFDYLGAVIGILALLFTALIGVQIYNYIVFEKKLRKYVKDKLLAESRKVDEKLDNSITLIVNEVAKMENDFEKSSQKSKATAIFLSLSNLGFVLFQNGDYQNAIVTLFNSLGAWNKLIKEDSEVEKAYKDTVGLLKRMKQMNIGLELEKEGINTYIKIAQRTEDEDIIEYACSFREIKSTREYLKNKIWERLKE